MATVAEILRASGFGNDEIARLDQRAITAFSGVLSAAEQERQAAELAQRSNVEFYENKIVPGLTQWETDRAEIEAARAKAEREAKYFRAAAVSAGIVPGDESRDAQGRYASGEPGSTPGSPTFTIDDVRRGLGTELGTISDVNWKHQQLYGKPMPIAPTELIKQAESQKLDIGTYATRAFKFPERETELAKQNQEKHDAEIAAKAAAERDRIWAEKFGSNPDVRQPSGTSAISTVRRGVQEGRLPDPLKMTDAARRQATRQQIHKELREREEAS